MIRVVEAEIGHLDLLFHGTSNSQRGEKIKKEGFLEPGLLVSSRKNLAPKPGAVYLTPSLTYGVIYALGGVWMGTNVSASALKDGSLGYLFSVQVKDLEGKIEADEDSIGEALYKKTISSSLLYLAKSLSTEKQWKDLQDGLYSAWAPVGKKLSQKMSAEEHIQIILNGGHVSHFGRVPIKEAWTFDKSLSSSLQKDGSNFFSLAKKVR